MSDEHKKQLQAQLWNIANTLRGAAEGHIRRYLIEDCNWLDAVIGLPANIFCGTDIPTCILVLKNPRDNPDNILFIDAPTVLPAILMNEPELSIIQTADGIVPDVRRMIEETRHGVSQVVNVGMTLLYWRIGKRIQSEVLGNERAAYGKETISTLSRQLGEEFGTGFSEKNLRRMLQFAEVFPEPEIVVPLIRQLTWTHILALIPLKKPLQREFYAEMCRVERWSVRTLRERIQSMLYERTAISKKPEEVAKAELAQLREEDKLTPDLVFRDPYILDFLGLTDRYLEKDLEDAILRELEHFLLEMGDGFTFQARQFRIQVDSDDFYIDLLFYHRRLRRLIAIDLKLGDFKAEYKGQMELYLRWLAKHEQQPGEEAPLGIILCAGKKQEQIELLELGQSGIHVAEYLTGLPDRKWLQEKLHAAIEISKARLDAKGATHET